MARGPKAPLRLGLPTFQESGNNHQNKEQSRRLLSVPRSSWHSQTLGNSAGEKGRLPAGGGASQGLTGSGQQGRAIQVMSLQNCRGEMVIESEVMGSTPEQKTQDR